MSQFAHRKRIELDTKVAALPAELDAWRKLSASGSSPLAKHHTQIRRLASQIEGLQSLVADQLRQLTTDDDLLRQARTIEKRLLAVHAVWDYFRSRLVLRTQEPFAQFLRAADAFAWACYRPVLDALGKTAGVTREPPLVSLQGDWSPNALPRGRAYDVVRSPGGWTDAAPFAAVIGDLPVPIIGVPWLHLEHLPHLVLVAHETGHLVEDDFHLGAAAGRIITDAPLERPEARDGWLAWRSEVFADVFACVAAGPAFAWSLADVLARRRADIEAERADAAGGWGEYPPSTLRMRLNAGALDALGFKDEAQAVLAAWMAAYPGDPLAELAADARTVAARLVSGGLLPEALHFSHVAGEYALALKLLAAGFPLNDETLQDSRALVAAACEHYRLDPAASNRSATWRKVRDRIVRARPPGVLDAADRADVTFSEDDDRESGRTAGSSFFAAIDALGDS